VQTLANGGLLLEVFRALPAVAIASERVEYERVVKRHSKDHPRAQVLARSLDALERADVQAVRGRARAARAMEAVRMAGRAFHGFVTDEAGDPLPGMTVRIASASFRAEAPTAPDGYFRVELPEPAPTKEPRAAVSDVASITIVDAQGNQVLDDPLALPLSLGVAGAYREYRVIPARKGSGAGQAPRARRAAPPRAKAKKRN
jgi:hypothetical protein